jgi:hypothetical protein
VAYIWVPFHISSERPQLSSHFSDIVEYQMICLAFHEMAFDNKNLKNRAAIRSNPLCSLNKEQASGKK